MLVISILFYMTTYFCDCLFFMTAFQFDPFSNIYDLFLVDIGTSNDPSQLFVNLLSFINAIYLLAAKESLISKY